MELHLYAVQREVDVPQWTDLYHVYAGAHTSNFYSFRNPVCYPHFQISFIIIFLTAKIVVMLLLGHRQPAYVAL